jgi:hypothetical protein
MKACKCVSIGEEKECESYQPVGMYAPSLRDKIRRGIIDLEVEHLQPYLEAYERGEIKPLPQTPKSSIFNPEQDGFDRIGQI